MAPEVLDLNEAASSTIKLITHVIGEGVDLKWTPGDDVRPVKVDRTQLDQILTNLCINARDAVGDVGTVWVETRNVAFDPVLGDESEDLEYSRDYVKLTVRDTGCGMSPETVSQIFDPFFTTKKDGKGTGLGLATVYGAVQQNDGVIKVQSAPGQGSTFVVYFPAHICETEKAATLETEPAADVRSRSRTILLVEDARPLLELTERMLTKMGHRVYAASMPGEALLLAKEHAGEIDLLFTDVVMPEMNGVELGRQIQELCPGVKELFMSGYTADIIGHHGVLDDGVHFLRKPFTMRALVEKIRDILEQP